MPSRASTMAPAPTITTTMAAISGGRVRRRSHERKRIAAANKHATASAPSEASSLLLTRMRNVQGADQAAPCYGIRGSGGHRAGLGANPGLGPHIDLVELQLGQLVGLEKFADIRADDREDEAERDRDYADVLQRERRVRHGRKRPARPGCDQPDGDDGASYQRGHGAPGVEPLPVH